MTTQPHNRQRPLAQLYEDQILRQEMRDRAAIVSEICRTRAASARSNPSSRRTRAKVPKPIDADIVIHLATCMKGNPGRGAWGATITTDANASLESYCYSFVTQPLLELEAMIAVLTLTDTLPGTVALHTTAKWIAEYLNNGQAETWQAQGWRKSSGEPVANADSWEELLRRYQQRQAAVAWIGQNATPEMSQAHQLAQRAYQARKPINGGQP